jgi:protein SCO1
MTKTSGLVVAALAVLALRPAVSMAHDPASHDAAMEAQGQPSGRSIYNLDEPWTTQEGVSAPLASLAGKPVVAAMGYTTCKDMCPAIVADMMWIEKHLPAGAADRVRFAFFSIDSEADTPERLKLYADSHGLDTTRWTLLRAADDDAVRQLAAALGVAYRPDGQGGFDHAAVISLIDEKGEIVFQQRGTQSSSDELLAALKSLLEMGNQIR